jgi:1-acyl-sn-glycerol-3-phosphate acyltransferase
MKPSNTYSSPKANFSVVARSGFFYLCQFLSVISFAPIIFALSRSTFEARYRWVMAWVRFNMWMLENICGLRYDLQGVENIPPTNGVILSKHQSAWETLAIQAIFPPLVFLLKKELLSVPIWGWALSLTEPIAIDRGAKTAALKKLLRDGEERLKKGRWVVIFPEGTRMPPGQKGQYNASGAMLAHRVGCPVVPIAHNAGEFWARQAFLKFPGVIKMRIGPVIDGSQYSVAEINRQAEEWIEGQMAEISKLGSILK